MHLAFIDDSQQKDPRRYGLGPLWALGAVIVPEDSLRSYADDITQIKDDLGIPAAEEIKWRPPRGSFLDGRKEILKSLRMCMLEAAIGRDIRATVAMVDRSSAYADLRDDEIGKILLSWIYERISMHLPEGNCVVIADKVGGGSREEARWLTETRELTNDGTEYVKANCIVLPIVTAPSHHVPHLQLADLVTAGCTAAVAGYNRDVDLIALMSRIFIRNRLDDAGGSGIKIHAASLSNLYFHVFGEKRMSRWVEYEQVWKFTTLPISTLPYAFDDGLNSI